MKSICLPGNRPRGGHYSPAIASRGMLYVSGQLSRNPETGELPEGGVAAHARQALYNLDQVLKAAGVTREQVVQCRVYIPDVRYWDQVNQEYAAFFGAHMPARTIVPTGALHHNCLVEIEATAEMEAGE